VSNIPGAGKTLELVEGLRATVRDIAARAEKLNQEFAARSNQERRKRERAAAEHAGQLAAAIAEADATFTAAKEAATARFEQRKERIGKAYQTSKEGCLQRVEDQTGGRKYELQKRMLQGERDRDTGFANAATALQEFKASLAAEQDALAQLEQSALTSFKGHRKLARLLAKSAEKASPAAAQDENQMLASLRELLDKTRGDLKRFRKLLLLRLFKYWPAWLAIILCEIPLVFEHYGFKPDSQWKAGWAVLASLAVVFVLRYVARRGALPLATGIADSLGKARRLHDACFEKSDAHYQQELERIKTEFETTTRTVDQELKHTIARAGELRVACRMTSDGKAFRILETNDRLYRAKVAQLEQEHAGAANQLKRTAEVRQKAETEASASREQKFTSEYDAQWQKLEADWQSRIQPVYETVAAANTNAEKLFPPWQPQLIENWAPPPQFSAAAKFARLEVDVEDLSELRARDKRLALPGPSKFSAPLCLVYPEQGSLLFETGGARRDEAIGALNNVILRLLANSPPGRLNFTIIDPVGLGQNFAGAHASGGLRGADHQQPHLDADRADRGEAGRPQRAHGEGHPDVSAQRIRHHCRVQRGGRGAGREVSFPGRRLLPGQFQRDRRQAPAQHRRQRRPLRRLYVSSTGTSAARCPSRFDPDDLKKSSVCVSGKDAGFIIASKPLPAPGG
jgi:S-DNA-T family DNA segregation ATPase FtsK/SpoIIIE